jgi:hypothetical protein
MGRRPKTIWALHNGTLYVKANYCGIHILILMADAFMLYHFKGDRSTYLKAEDCLNWFKNELEYGRKHEYSRRKLKEYEQFIELYSKAIDGTLGKDKKKERRSAFPPLP